MARPIWKGSISFGLLNVPVVLHSAEKKTDLAFHLIDSRTKDRIRYERINEETGEEVPWNEISKAYEYSDGKYVILEDKDFERAKPEATQTIELRGFVDREAIDPVYFETPYYLVPEKRGVKAYVLLREALKRSGKIGVAKVVIRTRQHLAVLLPREDALTLDIIRFEQELRDPSDLDFPAANLKTHKISTQEIEMAEKLIETMSVKWKPADYHDTYRDALMKFIQTKARKGPKAAAEAAPKAPAAKGEVIDVMDLLKKSLKGKAEPKAAPRPARATRKRA